MADWVYNWDVSKFANPREALKDAREAHRYVSHELGELEKADDPNRRYNLQTERQRLAAIAWGLSRYI